MSGAALPVTVEARADFRDYLSGNHDVRVKELHSCPEPEIDICDIAPPDDADGAIRA